MASIGWIRRLRRVRGFGAVINTSLVIADFFGWRSLLIGGVLWLANTVLAVLDQVSFSMATTLSLVTLAALVTLRAELARYGRIVKIRKGAVDVPVTITQLDTYQRRGLPTEDVDEENVLLLFYGANITVLARDDCTIAQFRLRVDGFPDFPRAEVWIDDDDGLHYAASETTNAIRVDRRNYLDVPFTLDAGESRTGWLIFTPWKESSPTAKQLSAAMFHLDAILDSTAVISAGTIESRE